MKNSIFFALLLAYLSPSFAGVKIQSRIHLLDIDSHGPDLLYLTSGKVVRLKKTDADTRKIIHSAIKKNTLVALHLSDENEVLSFQSLPDSSVKETSSGQVTDYEPTVVNSYEDVEVLFQGLNPNTRRNSECYNRAHVWSYELFKKHQVKSMKIFIFFTRKYIRDFNYNWWFHVAPLTYMWRYNLAMERVLDFTFTRFSAHPKEWSDIFMENRVKCPVITRYSEYSQNQEEEWCYLFKTNMYYYQPRDLENLEATGKQKTDWIQSEINNAYRQGFRRW